jgi:hypothetical protein
MKSFVRTVGVACLACVLGLANEAQGAATISLKAVAKNGAPIAATNTLSVARNDTITAEIYLFGWGTPPFDAPTNSGLIQTYNVTVLGEAGAISNGRDGTVNAELILPNGWVAPLTKDTCPCDNPAYPTCDPLYGCVGAGHTPANMGSINATRSDYIFFGLPNFPGVDVSTIDVRYGSTINGPDGQAAGRCVGGTNIGGPCLTAGECPGSTCNTNFLHYAGTLNLKVGASACGTYTFNISGNASMTFIANTEAFPIQVVPTREPFTLTVTGFACAGCGPSCDDNNPCTDDACNGQTCQHTNNISACSDESVCTMGDTCSNGTCIPGLPVDCSTMSDLCKSASCDAAGFEGNCDALTLAPNGSPCDDGLFCNGAETCINGECVPGTLPCTGGSGCAEINHACAPCKDASNCDDGFECTVESCAAGICTSDASQCTGVCCFPEGQCFDELTFEDCNSFSGGQYLGHQLTCMNDPDNDGATGCLDQCPRDPYKLGPGLCGCGQQETDSDGDGIANCKDCCPDTPQGNQVDDDGCPAFGACRSSTSSSCLNGVTSQFCISANGIYLGDGTTCENPCISCAGRGNLEAVPQEPSKSRFISFGFPVASCSSALRVQLVSLHHVSPPYSGGASMPFTSFEGQVRWVGPPGQYVESTANPTTFYASQLQCAPHYRDWSTVGLVHVMGSAIVPSSVYEVENVAASCAGAEASCTAVSAPLTVSTTRWGDVTDAYNPPATTAQPDFNDIQSMVAKFRSAPGAPIKARVLIAGNDANGNIDVATIANDFNFTHIAACVDAFRGKPYPNMISSCP